MINNTKVKFLKAFTVMQTKDFTYLTWKDLISLCSDLPATDFKTLKKAKLYSICIAAHDASNKRKEEAIRHDNFTLLRLDLDFTELDIDSVKVQLKALDIESYIIHSTAKNQQIDDVTGEYYGNRYRVYIELKKPLNYSDWSIIETYLSCMFNADDCATRPQQIMFLPTHFHGIKYKVLIGNGENDISALLVKANAFQVEEAKQYAQIRRNISVIPPKNRKTELLVGKKISLIETVNSTYEWDSILRCYGYKQQGMKWTPPESTSGSEGVIIFTGSDGKEKYYSHHTNDPCGTQSHSLDKFDFICIREYGGDNKKALCEIGNIFPEITKFNRREYAVNKSNDEAKQVMGCHHE
jgi:hypothetical protein